MQGEIHITFRDIEPSEAVAARIRERVKKLEHFNHRITSCRVVVEAAKRRQKTTDYQVHVDLTLPGGELVVSHDHHNRKPADDMYVAIRNSFDALERRLKALADKRRGHVKGAAPGAAAEGHVVRVFPDHGFISTADGELYFHRSAVADGGFDRLEIGDEVQFTVAPEGGAAGPQASAVHPLEKHMIVGEPAGQ